LLLYLLSFPTRRSSDLAATFDVRLDHTVGIEGHPYKYNPNLPFSNSWVRDPGVYGNFHSMRSQQLATSSSYYKLGPFMGTAKNRSEEHTSELQSRENLV